MKPKIVTRYETSDGQTVATLAEWKHSEIFRLLVKWKDGDASEMASDCFSRLIVQITTQAAEIVEILSVKESGRPRGSRDSKPRKKAAEASA